MKFHEKKIEHRYFVRVRQGLKKMEIRLNDCDYEVGDQIKLRSICTTDTNPNKQKFFYVDEPVIIIVVTDIITHDDCPMGLSKDYAILSFEILHTDKTTIEYAFQELRKEIKLAEEKHGVQKEVPSFWSDKIMEEVGERSKEVNEASDCMVADNYLTECLHIATTSIRAYQSEQMFRKEIDEEKGW